MKKSFKPYGELGIKLIAKLWKTVRIIPRKRLLTIIIQSLLLTILTVVVGKDLLSYRFEYSLTMNSLENALKNILGYGRFTYFILILQFLSIILSLFIFLFYFLLFIKRETNKLYVQTIEQMIVQTHTIANGHFQHSLDVNHTDDLNKLASNINEIVKRLQQSLDEERHLEAMKNELITNVSHDLRTPLTSIIGYLRIIENDEYRDELALRHYTSIAYEKAVRMQKLLEELFEYTRLQDHHISLNKYPVHLEEMLSELVIQNEYHLKEHQLICREQYDVPQPIVLGDGEKLARVFENLLMNAIQYGKNGKYIDLDIWEVEHKVMVRISNDGEMISKIDLPHVFDRFYRVEKSRSMATGGTGLGLSIAKSIITHHNGLIEATSDEQRTSFTVTLPKQYE